MLYHCAVAFPHLLPFTGEEGKRAEMGSSAQISSMSQSISVPFILLLTPTKLSILSWINEKRPFTTELTIGASRSHMAWAVLIYFNSFYIEPNGNGLLLFFNGGRSARWRCSQVSLTLLRKEKAQLFGKALLLCLLGILGAFQVKKKCSSDGAQGLFMQSVKQFSCHESTESISREWVCCPVAR